MVWQAAIFLPLHQTEHADNPAAHPEYGKPVPFRSQHGRTGEHRHCQGQRRLQGP